MENQSYLNRDIASSTPNIKRVFAYSPQCQVSDPVATSEAVEGEPEVLVVATTHVTFQHPTSQFASNTLASGFQFGATANTSTVSAQQGLIFNFISVF